LFLDVPYGSWFYNDITELANTPTHGYGKFISSIAYNVTEPGFPVYDKIFEITEMTTAISLGQVITESINNPISVYQNNVNIGYLRIENTANDTIVHLKRYAPQGSFIRVIAWGVPKMMQDTDPAQPNYSPTRGPVVPDYTDVEMPNTALGFKSKYPSYVYVYATNYEHFSETVRLNGTPLRRVPSVLDTSLKQYWREAYKTDILFVESENKFYEWDVSLGDYATTYIPSEELIYTITSQGKYITSPYLNNEFVTASYIIGIPQNGIVREATYRVYTENIYAKSTKMVYTNRFFPSVLTTKLQTLLFLDRLTIHLILTYSSVRDVNDLLSDKEYTESVFADVRELASEPWWWKYIRNLENLKLSNGVYLLNYGPFGEVLTDATPRPTNTKLGYLNPITGYEQLITRGEVAYLINRFRKYYIEVLG
jgi:hypothetical protein